MTVNPWTSPFRPFALLTVVALALPGAQAVAQEESDDTPQAKGLYYAPVPQPRPGVKFNIYSVKEKGGGKKVKTSHKFKPGERLQFQFELNRPGYVYLLNRTIKGHPDRLNRFVGPRGIKVLLADDRQGLGDPTPRSARYTLLFPTQEAGTDNWVDKGILRVVPSRGAFSVDEEPGIEKLYLIYSAKPIEIGQYFDLQTGQLREHAAGGGGDTAKGVEGAGDVLDQLNKDLADWSDNSDVSIAKGLNVDGYGLGRNADRPWLAEIDLVHYPR